MGVKQFDIKDARMRPQSTRPHPLASRPACDTRILQSTDLIVRVLRTRTIGAYTEIAGEFIARIDANRQRALGDRQSEREVEAERQDFADAAPKMPVGV